MGQLNTVMLTQIPYCVTMTGVEVPSMPDTKQLTRALLRLERANGRIARRNARLAVFGALRAIRLAVNREFPAIPKTPARPLDRTESAVRSQSWRFVEYRIVKPGRVAWDRQRAEAFNLWISDRDGHSAKPIRFDLPDRSRYLGIHDQHAIRLAAGYADREKWRTLLHEIAHYRERGHGAAFKRELVRVYRLWRAWMAGRPE